MMVQQQANNIVLQVNMIIKTMK